MKEAMQLDATLQLPDGKQIPVVVEFDATQLESSLADTSLANLVARAVEVLGSRPRALAWLRTPLAGLAGRTPLEVMADAEDRQQVEDILGRIEHGVFG
jgi:putative toxin-antitoxin system antitoxin component (TIGR02293 family)